MHAVAMDVSVHQGCKVYCIFEERSIDSADLGDAHDPSKNTMVHSDPRTKLAVITLILGWRRYQVTVISKTFSWKYSF